MTEPGPCPCGGAKCELSVEDRRHGTVNGYINLRCRCDPCREAHAINYYRNKVTRRAKGIPTHVHGTPGGYGYYGCRCDDCRAAWHVENSDRYQRRKLGQTLCQQGLQVKPKLRRKETQSKRWKSA